MRKSILLSLALVPSLALASGYSLPNVNPRDLSMSASAVAAQVDAGATFAMPAALARLAGPSARVGAGILNIGNEWKDTGAVLSGALPEGASTSSIDLQFVPLPTVYASYSGRLAPIGNRAYGVGVSLDPFGGGAVKWPSDWVGRYRIVSVDRKVFRGILAGGIEIIPRVRLGGGLVYYYTTESLEQNAFMYPFSSPAGAPDATGKLDLKGGAPSFDVSLEADPIPGVPLRIGIDYKHKATQKLSGDVEWSGLQPGIALTPPELQAVYAATDADETLTIPNTLNIGIAYKVIEPLVVTFTYTFDRWLVYDQDLFTASNGAQIPVARDYKNGYTLRAGGEYEVSKKLAVRAGVQRDVSGLKTDTYSPTLPDASSWAGSLGATYRFSRGVSLDAGVFYAKMDKVTSTNNGLEPNVGYPTTVIPPTGVLPVPQPGTTLRGEYSIYALIYGLSVGWTPGLATAP